MSAPEWNENESTEGVTDELMSIGFWTPLSQAWAAQQPCCSTVGPSKLAWRTAQAVVCTFATFATLIQHRVGNECRPTLMLQTGEVMSIEDFCIACGSTGEEWKQALVV